MPVSMDTAISNSMLMMASQVMTFNRPGFQQMITDIEAGLVKRVIIMICHVSDVIICKSRYVYGDHVSRT